MEIVEYITPHQRLPFSMERRPLSRLARSRSLPGIMVMVGLGLVGLFEFAMTRTMMIQLLVSQAPVSNHPPAAD